MTGMKKYIFFNLNEETFAIPVEHVISIEKMQHLTSIPKASRFIQGLADIRETKTAVIDFKKILEMRPSAQTADTKIIVVKINDLQVGLIVDQANDIKEVLESDIESTQLVLRSGRETYLRGVAKVEDKLVLFINLAELFNQQETIEIKEAIDENKPNN